MSGTGQTGRRKKPPRGRRRRKERTFPGRAFLMSWKARRRTAERTFPTVRQLSAELEREREKERRLLALRGAVQTVLVAAAAAVLITKLAVPVFRIEGSSMTPTLSEGDVVLALRGAGISQGDLVVFYYENRVLVKRCIAGPGQWVDIDGDGNVYVDGELLDEPYLAEKAYGGCDISLPYQVPEGRIFVMWDHRSVSVDSRNRAVGCIAEEQLAGKVVFRVWPLSGLGTINEKGW